MCVCVFILYNSSSEGRFIQKLKWQVYINTLLLKHDCFHSNGLYAWVCIVKASYNLRLIRNGPIFTSKDFCSLFYGSAFRGKRVFWPEEFVLSGFFVAGQVVLFCLVNFSGVNYTFRATSLYWKGNLLHSLFSRILLCVFFSRTWTVDT